MQVALFFAHDLEIGSDLESNKEMRSPRSRLKIKANRFSCRARIFVNSQKLWTINKEGNLDMKFTLAEDDDKRPSIRQCNGKPNVTPLSENTSQAFFTPQ